MRYFYSSLKYYQMYSALQLYKPGKTANKRVYRGQIAGRVQTHNIITIPLL